MKKQIIGAQGEITIIKLDSAPQVETRPHAGGLIISHSESGHHHVLTGGDVLEPVSPAQLRVRTIYAKLERTEQLKQNAATPHAPHMLEPGWYEFRIAREFDPFSDQIRDVAD